MPDQKVYPAMQKLIEKKRIRHEKNQLITNSLLRGKEKKHHIISLLVQQKLSEMSRSELHSKEADSNSGLKQTYN